MLNQFDELDRIYGLTEKEKKKQMREYGMKSTPKTDKEEAKDEIIQATEISNDDEMRVKLIEGKDYSQVKVSTKQSDVPDPRVVGATFVFDSRLDKEELDKIVEQSQSQEVSMTEEEFEALMATKEKELEESNKKHKKYRFGSKLVSKNAEAAGFSEEERKEIIERIVEEYLQRLDMDNTVKDQYRDILYYTLLKLDKDSNFPIDDIHELLQFLSFSFAKILNKTNEQYAKRLQFLKEYENLVSLF